MANQEHIRSQLQKEILLLQGFKPAGNIVNGHACLDCIQHAFPQSTFPLGAIHEFFCSTAENASASSGFMTSLLSSLLNKEGIGIWICSTRMIFPPALQFFHVVPHRILFINLKKEKEKLWAMEEALRCESVAVVVGEINEVSFTESRRLQLAVEQSKATGFLLRRNPKNMATACVTRWKIQQASSDNDNNLPGIGFPRWKVELIKVRNGKPGCWEMEWRENKLTLLQNTFIPELEERKIV